MRSLLAFAALLFAFPVHAEVTFDWITVGDPGNACDTQSQGCFGTVQYTYQISKYEVTNSQYAEFLNAVAATDTNELYSTNMGSGYGGITRSGSSGSHTYSAIAGREEMPVNYVSFYDVLRFANWLHNGQPSGAQDSTTTEDGAYDMSLGSSVVREVGANVVLTSENEWYKAAYYAGSGSYYDYPAGSDTQTTCAVPGPTANTANCDVVVYDLTDVGSYTGSASPSGSFDQGGNVSEWNEALIGSNRGLRGGGFGSTPDELAASVRVGVGAPPFGAVSTGFRVASIAGGWFPTCGDSVIEGNEECDDGETDPGDGCDSSCEIEPGWTCDGEPSVCTELPPLPALSPLGLLLVAAGLLGFRACRRGRA